MIKIIFIFAITVSVILLLSEQSSYAQSTPTVNLTKIISEDKELRLCPTCSNRVDVLYESPNTVALSSDYIDLIWKGVDVIKKHGYKIDDVVSYTTTSYTGTGSINTMVVMSK
ncbi:hypothetical protein NMY3_03028 [Candidatus Nitrosocosmicus oleophilus]|uniref:Uncharacterized protein n=1 Tax=Candidatus Nitrosocosmicus oleophilus TaxID=1353260 RepID=A0A654M176_9ARCH|nr:hypothetical protein [Candidatus Nitrosocosmicus oleophilus]ALI37215.1 hypothetical protein NMY3_03028 [Candidatus Nitrosocosmicus oleophilus]